MSTAAVGALVASRRPAHPVGWLLLGVGLALKGSLLVQAYVDYGLLARPGSLPGAGYLAGFADSTVLIWLSCAGFVLLLTPTGSLPSPRWRWWARLAAAAPVVVVLGSVVQPDPLAPDYHGNPLAVPALARVLVLPAVAGVVVVLVSLLVGAASLLVRFRRARGTERQQLRWLAYAAALAAGLLLVALVAGFLPSNDDARGLLALGPGSGRQLGDPLLIPALAFGRLGLQQGLGLPQPCQPAGLAGQRGGQLIPARTAVLAILFADRPRRPAAGSGQPRP